MLYYLIPPIHLAGLGSAVFAVMSTRTAQGAISWVVCLVTFPHLAVPAYWVFGPNKFRGCVPARQDHLALVHQRLASPNAELHQTARLAGTDQSQLRSTGTAGVRAGDGRQQDRSACPMEMKRFASILSGIDTAERYVLVQFYIVPDDDIGRQFADRLIARTTAGVAARLCRLMSPVL